MKTTDFTISIVVDKNPQDAFNAICNVAGWWQGEIKGKSSKLDDQFIYKMGDTHFSIQKVHEFVPNKKLVWLVTESKLSFLKYKSEWTGTKIIFELSQEGNNTKITFTHKGLNSGIECYDACSNGWTQLIQKSLYSLITTGKGVNVF